MAKYVCTICGYVYDEAAGDPENGVAPGTLWNNLPDGWACPLCGAPKDLFELQSDPEPEQKQERPAAEPSAKEDESLRELSFGELSALCSNLAKGCEKQYRAEEAKLLFELAAYYAKRQAPVESGGFSELLGLVDADLKEGFPAAKGVASAAADRGALRALVWGEKVSRILTSLLGKFEREGDAMLAGTNVYVCEICGFVYIGDAPPEICPVCKVPSLKLRKIAKEAV